jgi:hypothetical protein
MITVVTLLLIAAAPREGIVKADVAEVRSGPSDKFYVTNRVRRGARVEIVEDLPGGWLKIKPPPGSFSYINLTFLDPDSPKKPTYVVVALSNQVIPVLIGSETVLRDDKGQPRRPDIAGARLKEGTLVTAIGQPLDDADGHWMPIEPPPSEVRYLHTSALEPSATGTTFAAATPAVTPAAGGALPAPSTPSANPVQTPEDDWKAAARAEQDRNYPEAIRLYSALGARTVSSHPQISTAALQRAAWLQTATRPPAAPATTVSSSRTAASSTFQPAASPGGYRIRLARAGWSIDGKPTYRMDVLHRGIYEPAGYAVSGGPQVQLEPWLGRDAEVTGTLWYHGPSRGNVLTVNGIKAAP